MDLYQDIQVINPKDKIVIPEEAQMEDARTSTISKRPEPFPTGNNRNIPVSVQELLYGGKAAGVGTSKSLDRHNELISSSEEVHGPRKYRGSSEGFDTYVFQRTSPKDNSLVEKLKHVVRGPEEEVGPRKGQKPSGSSPSPHKQKSTSKSSKQGKEKGKAQVEQALPTEPQNSQEIEDSHGKCIQYGKNSDGIQKQGRGKNKPILFQRNRPCKSCTSF
ncbi:hypothetical protein O181_050565 [Austropuccinia psidii MF-1]|uniref:Uncharacterized protein n=1 Tax=Austropuccinia psidii MF-1 TaxID=1389203 RepID=A0A9Q3HR10_9BASI|nr:hypothetical protein [Austropuccinia psidii MF-1]